MVKIRTIFLMGFLFYGPLAASSLSQLSTSLQTFVTQINGLLFLLNNNLVPLTPEEQTMKSIAQPLYDAIAGVGTAQPDKLTNAQTQNYLVAFNTYVAQQGTDKPLYFYYAFGSYFLPMLLAKNMLKTALLKMQNFTDNGSIQASDVTYQTVVIAQYFTSSYNALDDFLQTVPENFISPASPAVQDGYATFLGYANTITSFSTMSASSALILPQVTAGQEEPSFKAFREQNFSPMQLQMVSPQDFMDQFVQLKQLDPQGLYQGWEAYLMCYYWFQRFSTTSETSKKEAANKFQVSYANFTKLKKSLTTPYQTQLAGYAPLVKSYLDKLDSNTFR